MRLILLDRDGVINFDSPDYIRTPEQWQPLPGALDAIAALGSGGFRLGVCTNQSGIGRGLLSARVLAQIHRKLCDGLRARGAALDTLHYCPHLPDAGCHCRKPEPGMLLAAMEALDIPAAQTCFVGDSTSDLLAARRAGCRGVLVRTGNGARTEAALAPADDTPVFDDLAAFARSLG